jgi:NAD(P)-dependent dehydrogenase (short-subunit alcohol dehydrogenase family)/acyl carrier protein
LEELSAEEHEPAVAIRGGQRWVCRDEPAPVPDPDATRASAPLRDGGTYVITGGLGQVGLTLAEQLATAAKSPKLVLVGRSSFPDRSQWEHWPRSHGEHEERSGQIQRLLALEAKGAQVMVARADVSQPEQLEAVLAQAEARFGHVHGVVHAAGRSGMGVRQVLGEVSRADCESLFAGPVRGALALSHALRGRTLDFVVLHGSLASVLGGLGLTAYAAVQSFLEAFAALTHRASATPWLSVAWDPWPLRQSGAPTGQVLAPEPPEALRLLLGMLRAGTSPHWRVSRQSLAARIAASLHGAQAKNHAAAEGRAPRVRSDGFVAPRDDIETQVAAIWQEMLGVEEVGIHDHFFELGGHSLMGVQILSRIRETFQVELSMKSLFDSPTVAALALAIVNAQLEHMDPAMLEALVGELEQEGNP